MILGLEGYRLDSLVATEETVDRSKVRYSLDPKMPL
jgi:hypothetical protein